jgi:hypothetical protein
MSVTVHAPQLVWARAHRAALVIVVLAMALAATVGLLAARLVSDAAPAPATSVTTVHVPPIQNPCMQLDRPGRPVPC